MNRSLFDQIQNGPDWLEHSDLAHFLCRHDLHDVEVQLVGPRRTFSGKAWPASSIIRMVSVGVHPTRWLLTFIHELAHIADFRQRIRDLEKKWGRPYRPGRQDARQVWRLERPHGERWRREFVRLAKEAVSEGFFPGNEDVVLTAAEAGATTLDGVLLDLRADPRVDAEDLCRADEQQRERMAQAQLQTEEFKRLFKAKQVVHFNGGPRRGVITGNLVRVNRKSCTVAAQGSNWHVPHGFLRPGAAPPDARPAKRAASPRARFSPGDPVYFVASGRKLQGQIVRVNRKTCTVQTPEGNWRVTFSLLRVLKK